jgi:hypothetical protein
MLVSLAMLSTGFGVSCGLTAKVFMAKTDGTHVTFMMALGVDCPNEQQKFYRSREATVDVNSPTEVGAILLRAMAQEISEQVKADKIEGPVSADEILEHAELQTVEP